MPPQEPYAGTERKLVLAFDLGTTFSGISYSILDPGLVPRILPVTRFPGLAKASNGAKIPTVIYYDRDGHPRAIGAEAEREDLSILAEDSDWNKAEWFKLHLRPMSPAPNVIPDELPPLPPGKTVVDLFADFYRYMKQCAKVYIEEIHHLDGPGLWRSGNEVYILSHPNGWEGAQQALMRNAAVAAGLVPDTHEGRERITFVTEGEASLHFCVERGLTNELIQSGDGVMIVDAGGGTLDISAYASERDEFEEIAASQCHFKGSVFVTRAAATYLDGYLRDSRFYNDVPDIVDAFDKTTKLVFRTPDDLQYIKFGSVRDKDPTRGILAGRLKLEGQVIAGFFEPSIKCIVDAAIKQRPLASRPVTTVFVVGGFAANDYLFAHVEESLRGHGFKVHRPDGHLNKAVSDGSIAGYLRPTVRTRVTKYTYGNKCSLPYNNSHPEHRKRQEKCYGDLNGDIRVGGGFDRIIEKNIKILESQEIRVAFCYQELRKESIAKSKVVKVTSYRGDLEQPEFVDQDPENFHDICTVRADLTNLVAGLQPRVGETGIVYFEIDYEIIVFLGSAEFKVQLGWEENGVEKRGPVEILFNTGV